MKFTDLSCKDFTYELSSKKPIPGGGGAAALAASLGVALNMMVANFSKGKKKLLQYDGEHEEILKEGQGLRVEFLDLVEKDALYFEPLSKAYSMPSATKEERAIKEEEMEKCLKNALIAPVETMELALEGINLHEKLIDIASKNIISDIGVGVQLLKAALNSAYLNVIINVGSIKDEKYGDEIKETCDKLLLEGNLKADSLYEKVLKLLNGKET